jgi:hypothetical protein
VTTAPTPSEKVQRLAIPLEIVGAVPDMNYVTVPRHVARDASVELLRLQAENECLRAELEARKPPPLSDWIDADERRPEAYLDVLVVIDGKWVTTGEWLHAQKTWCWEQTGDEPDESRVTHWMHVPPPPAQGITGGSS